MVNKQHSWLDQIKWLLNVAFNLAYLKNNQLAGCIVPICSLDFTAKQCENHQYSATWDAGSATSAVIEIRDTRAIAYGDDFCLDDISFVKQP